MKSTETKWTKLISVRIEKEIIEYLNKDNSEISCYQTTLSQKINQILKEYIKEKGKKNT